MVVSALKWISKGLAHSHKHSDRFKKNTSPILSPWDISIKTIHSRECILSSPSSQGAFGFPFGPLRKTPNKSQNPLS